MSKHVLNKTYGGVRLDVKSLTMCVRFKVFRLSVSALLSFSIRYEIYHRLNKRAPNFEKQRFRDPKRQKNSWVSCPNVLFELFRQNNFSLDFLRGVCQAHKVCTSGPTCRNETLVKAFENYSKAYIKVSVPVPFCLVSLPWCIYVVQHCG